MRTGKFLGTIMYRHVHIDINISSIACVSNACKKNQRPIPPPPPATLDRVTGLNIYIHIYIYMSVPVCLCTYIITCINTRKHTHGPHTCTHAQTHTHAVPGLPSCAHLHLDKDLLVLLHQVEQRVGVAALRPRGGLELLLRLRGAARESGKAWVRARFEHSLWENVPPRGKVVPRPQKTLIF